MEREKNFEAAGSCEWTFLILSSVPLFASEILEVYLTESFASQIEFACSVKRLDYVFLI